MGSFLLAAGEPGMRIALANSRIMVHQPSGGAQGMAADIEIQAREILRMRSRLNSLYAKYTGQKIEAIELAMDRDKFLEADEAKEFGLIDEVFEKRPEQGEGDSTGAGGRYSGLIRAKREGGECWHDLRSHWPSPTAATTASAATRRCPRRAPDRSGRRQGRDRSAHPDRRRQDCIGHALARTATDRRVSIGPA